MGKTLLDDPVASSKLFDRESSSGNRFIPYTAISNSVKSYLDKIGNVSISTDSVSTVGLLKETGRLLLRATESIAYEDIFFHVTDPSSHTQEPPE